MAVTYDELVAEVERLTAKLAESQTLFNSQNIVLAAVEANERSLLESLVAEREAHASSIRGFNARIELLHQQLDRHREGAK